MSGYQESQLLDDAHPASPTISTGPKKTKARARSPSALKLTQTQLKKMLEYNPATGDFFWLAPRAKNLKKGDVAGYKSNESGYVRITIGDIPVFAHRLAWMYMEGFFPKGLEVDHIDRNRANNSWANLRLISHKCNSRNAKIRKDNKSGITGVSFSKERKKWAAEIVVDSKRIHLGRFKNKKDAVTARWRAEVEHGFPGCNTTSSALEYLNRISA